MVRPLWLADSETQALLNRLVDRLDAAESRGSGKAQSVLLGERTWPELFNAKFESRKEELWGQFVEMCGWGWMKVKPEASLRSRSGYAHSVRVTVVDEGAVREATGRMERKKSVAERWREAVFNGLEAEESVKAAVADYCIELSGHTMDEVVARLNVVKEMMGRGLLLRELSAQLFWGMSKVLDKRQGLIEALLGVDECPFHAAPVQLQVYIPKEQNGRVLFIENLLTFERAMRSEMAVFSGMTLVFASGFKGSAQRLRSPSGCSLFYSGRGVRIGPEVEKFESWLTGAGGGDQWETFFWGDLDMAGMQILMTLRSTFPEARAWKPGYEPMLKALMEGKGHKADSADKGGQREVEQTGCGYADSELIPAMKAVGRYVDQEMFEG